MLKTYRTEATEDPSFPFTFRAQEFLFRSVLSLSVPLSNRLCAKLSNNLSVVERNWPKINTERGEANRDRTDTRNALDEFTPEVFYLVSTLSHILEFAFRCVVVICCK